MSKITASSANVLRIVLAVVLFVAQNSYAQPPADDLILWLDAGAFVITDSNDTTPDGELVVAWEDRSDGEILFDSEYVEGSPRLTMYPFGSIEEPIELPVVYFDGASGFGLANDALLQPTEEFSIYAYVVPKNPKRPSQIILANFQVLCGFGLGIADK